MAHRAAVKEASQKGRRPSLEVIEELLGFAGPGAIKRVTGAGKNLFIGLPKGAKGKEGFPASEGTLSEELSKLKLFFRRQTQGKMTNLNRPTSTVGGELRPNVGGQKPPGAELETLALRKQARPNPKDTEIIITKLRELDFPDTGIVRFLASKSKEEISKMALRFRKELLASPPKPKGPKK